MMAFMILVGIYGSTGQFFPSNFLMENKNLHHSLVFK